MFQDAFRQNRHSYNSALTFRLLHKHRILSQGVNKDRSLFLEPITTYYLNENRPHSLYEPYISVEACKPSFTQRLRPRVIQENQPVKLSCLVDGRPSPNVIWFKGRTTLTGADPHYEIYYSHGICTLAISACRVSDTGDYICRAENSNGMDETSAFLCVENRTRKAKRDETFEEVPAEERREEKLPEPPAPKPKKRREVTFAPQIMEEIEGLTVYEGATIMLRCRIDGKPTPTVTWTRNGEKLSAGDRIEITDDFGTPTLILRGITSSEAGEYICAIENTVGKASTSADVVVKAVATTVTEEGEQAPAEAVSVTEEGEPEVAVPETEAGQTSSAPQEEQTEEEVSVVSSEETKPEVKEEESTEISSDDTKSVSFAEQPELEGDKAKVSKKFKFTKHLCSLNLKEGDKMVLECAVEGVTDSDVVQWTRNGKVIPENPDFARKHIDDIYSLEVAEMFPEDSGTFGMEVVSDDYTFQSVCSVIVQGEDDGTPDPNIETFPGSLTVQEGDIATFECKVSGSQPIKGSWFFHDSEIEEKTDKYALTSTDVDFKLVISKADLGDEGTYFLIISNDQSEVTMAFSLQILPN